MNTKKHLNFTRIIIVIIIIRWRSSFQEIVRHTADLLLLRVRGWNLTVVGRRGGGCGGGVGEEGRGQRHGHCGDGVSRGVGCWI